MITWQQARQLKYLLAERDWAGTSSKVFGRVIVTTRPRELTQGLGVILPLALIVPQGAAADPEHPALSTQTWSITVVCAAHADALGQAGLLGANRVGDQDGRGLLEIEEELIATLHANQAECGLAIYSRFKSAAQATVDPNLGYLHFRTYTFESLATDDRYYHPATRFSATARGVGAIADLAWKAVPDRFDFFRYHIRFAAGDTPPATTTDGGLVGYIADRTTEATTYTAPVAGEYSFSIFVEYDEGGDVVEGDTLDTADAASAPDSDTDTLV